VSGGDLRPDRHILLEPGALLARIGMLLAEGDRARFDADERYRWVLHRVWIAAGNEALAYARLTGASLQAGQPWGRLYRLRNMLAHDRLPDIDEDEVWRITAMRTTPLRRQVRDLLK
jgi:uncharacterized protein with HEPN domain